MLADLRRKEVKRIRKWIKVTSLFRNKADGELSCRSEAARRSLGVGQELSGGGVSLHLASFLIIAVTATLRASRPPTSPPDAN